MKHCDTVTVAPGLTHLHCLSILKAKRTATTIQSHLVPELGPGLASRCQKLQVEPHLSRSSSSQSLAWRSLAMNPGRRESEREGR